MSWLPDWLTGFDSENARKAALADDELRRLNQAAIDSGRYTPEQAAIIAADYAAQVQFGVDAQRSDIQDTFTAGVEEGRNSVKDFFNNVVWQALKSIPLVVWLGLAVALFFWLGGPVWLKGRLAKS